MSRLTKNIFYNFVGQGLVLVLGFVAVKYVFKQLGEDALGIIYFTLTMNGVLVAVLEMGISSTTAREVASHFHDEPGYINDLIRTASLFYWCAYVLLAVVVYLGARVLVEGWINLNAMDAGTAARMVQVLGISALIGLPRTLYSSVIRGLQRMEITNLIDVATMSLQQGGIVVILALGGGLEAVVYWLGASFILSLLAYLIAVGRFLPWRALLPLYCTDVVKRNLSYASNMTAISLLAMVHIQADKLMVSKLLPIGLLGYYGFAYNALSRSSLLTSAVAQAAFPSFSSLFSMGERGCMILQYRKLQDLLCYGTVPLFAAVPFAVLPVFGFVFTPDVARMLLLPVTFLALGFYMNGTLNVPYVFSLAVGKPEITTKTNFLALFIVLPVTAVLIYFFGLSGAGFSWVFYHLFAYSYGVPRICSECLEMRVSEWYLHVLKIVVLASVTYGVSWIVVASGDSYTLRSLLLGYFTASLAFVLIASQMVGEELRVVMLRLPRLMKMRSSVGV